MIFFFFKALFFAGLVKEMSLSFTLWFFAFKCIFRCFAELGGDGDLVDVFAQEALYLAELGLVVQADEGDGAALGAGAGGSAYAVDVVLGVLGNVKVYYQVYIVYIYSARYYIGGYKDVDVAVAELVHYVVTLGLGQVGVHLANVQAKATQ